jgi:hypothetical protein
VCCPQYPLDDLLAAVLPPLPPLMWRQLPVQRPRDAVSAAVADFDSRPASGAPAGVRSPGIQHIVISRAGSVSAPAAGNIAGSTILATAAVVGGGVGAAADAVSIEAG